MPVDSDSSVADAVAMATRIEANKQVALQKRTRHVTDQLEICATSAITKLVNSEECKNNILLVLRKDVDWDIFSTWAEDLDERFTGQDGYSILEEAVVAVTLHFKASARPPSPRQRAEKRPLPEDSEPKPMEAPQTSAGEALGSFTTKGGTRVVMQTCDLRDGIKPSSGSMEVTDMKQVDRRALRNAGGWMAYRMCLPRDCTLEDLHTFVSVNGLQANYLVMGKVSECWLCCRRDSIKASGRKVESLAGVPEGFYYSFDGTIGKIVQQICELFDGSSMFVGTLDFDMSSDRVILFKDACEYVKDMTPDEWLEMEANCAAFVKKKCAKPMEDSIHTFAQYLNKFLNTIWSAVGCVKKVTKEDLLNSVEIEWHRLPREMKFMIGLYWCEFEKIIKEITLDVIWVLIMFIYLFIFFIYMLILFKYVLFVF